MPITEIHVHWNYDSFSVCPRCKATMEREYQAFCDRCGQQLDWSKYEDAEVVYTGWSGPAANEDDEQERETQTKFGTKLASNASVATDATPSFLRKWK